MLRQPIPQVFDDHLYLQDYLPDHPRGYTQHTTPRVTVGSHQWYTWLADAQNKSFTFKSHFGSFTARHERQRNSWYWYAYRKQQGRIRKMYLGRPQELTAERLNSIAINLCTYSSCQHNYQLFEAKLRTPSLARDVLPRPRLLAKLQNSLETGLTVISAPAGWGKTTLLRQWHNEVVSQGCACSWLSLDKEDNQAIRFWSHFIAALEQVMPGLSDLVSIELFCAHATLTQGLHTLLHALDGLATPATLVLDNYHVLYAQEIHQALTTLIELMPLQLHLVIVSRTRPELPLARLRAQRLLNELHMDDLRFLQQEMLQLLPRLLAQPLTTEQYVTLATRANGWITALHLLVASIHEGGTIEEVCALPQRHLNDYMVEEVLLQQPEEIQRFLLATAPLDSFDISLASAVSLQANSEAMLDYLSRHNIFIEAQDSQRGWFRYQPLFSEVLRGYLRQHSASLLPELYLRACTWYQQNGLLNNALYYATQATGNAMIALPQAGNQLGNLTNYYPVVQAIPTLKHARRELFTQRENEVIDLLLQGASNREIAAKLIISEGTVKKHMANICGKLEVKSRTQALAKLMPQLTPALNSRDVPASRAG
ncbi:LuxR family transcriptional regulator [Ktedonobacter robiniae]|uniref:HTH luxR-type domain-containing protein n=1 Tax=Ktedonobacter robiniae TaxID=2778365 RepID=A0ABQ3V391_9CHLR|nr:LuxR family transcriptional regulator [Ktedonobacter robiniae]GHO59636.1 hypothetical protein KSB_81110 [Ktedonobacter robiniae]